MAQIERLHLEITEQLSVTTELAPDVLSIQSGRVIDKHNIVERYYAALRQLQNLRAELRVAYTGLESEITRESNQTDYAAELAERREIAEANVTSLTHERWKARTTKQANGWLSGRY